MGPKIPEECRDPFVLGILLVETSCLKGRPFRWIRCIICPKTFQFRVRCTFEIQLPNVGAEVVLRAGGWRSQKVIMEIDVGLDMSYVRLDWVSENRVPSSSIFPDGINGNRYT